MKVRRIVANIATSDPAAMSAFYRDLLGLDVVMDLGWIVTFSADASMRPQVSAASEGGSGTPVPDLSVEVDDLDEAIDRAKRAGLPIEYGPCDEPWGVRRFYVRDPSGKLINVLCHAP